MYLLNFMLYITAFSVGLHVNNIKVRSHCVINTRYFFFQKGRIKETIDRKERMVFNLSFFYTFRLIIRYATTYVRVVSSVVAEQIEKGVCDAMTLQLQQ